MSNKYKKDNIKSNRNSPILTNFDTTSRIYRKDISLNIK